MASSKIFLGLKNILGVKLGSQDGKLCLGEIQVYPLGKTIANAIVTCDSAIYNGSVQIAQNIVVTLSGETLVEGTDYTIRSNTGGTNAGSYSVVVGGEGEYVGVTSGTFVINKVTPTVTAPTAITGITYNGSAHALVNAGSTNYGTLKYSLDGSTYSASIPSGTNATSYTVYYKVEGDSNINEVPAQTVSVTIAKADGRVITAPTAISGLIYNGNSQTIINSGSGTGTMMYKLDSGSWGTSIPTATNATTYTVYYKASASTNYNESASGSVSCSIAKVTPTVTAPTPITGITYDGVSHVLANAGSTNYGTLVYCLNNSGGTYSTSIPSSTNANSYDVWYKVSGDSNVNSTTALKIECTIAKANPSYTAPTTRSVLTYNASAQALLNGGSTSDGTMQYSSDNSSWSTTIPTGTNVGTYTSYWRIVGDANHNDKGSASISTEISANTVNNPTITLSPSEYTYNGNPCQPTPTVKVGSLTISSSEYTVSYSNNVSAGTATCTITDVSGGNYIVNGSKTFTINKVTPTVTAPTPKTLTYNTQSQVLANSGSTDYGTMVYCLNNSGGTYSTIVPSAINANTTYYVWYKVSGDSNVNSTSPESVECMIAEKRVTTPTITPSHSSYTYDGSAHTPSVTVKDGSTVIPSSEYTVSYSNNVNAGNGTIVISDNTLGNYYISGTTTFTINKASCYINTPPTAKSLTYNGSAQALVNGGSGGSGTILYKLGSSGTYGTSIPTSTNAGSYTVYYKASASTNYNEGCESSVSCSIAKKAISCTAPTAKSLAYNGSAQALVNAGSVVGGSMTYSTASTGTYSSSIPSGTSAGSYTVYWKGAPDSSGNYSGSCSGSVDVTIAKASCSVTTAPTAKTGLVYTSSAQALVNAGASNCTMQYKLGSGSWSTSIPSATTAGSYTVYYKATSSNSDYSDSASGSVSCSIAKTNCSVTVSGINGTYNGSAQNLLTVSNNCESGTMHYRVGTSGSWTTTIPTATDVGTWTIYWYRDATTNYNGNYSSSSPGSVTAKINCLAPTISANPAAKTGLVYNGSSQTLLSGGTANVSGTWSYGSGTNANTYSNVSWTFTPSSSNYCTKSGTVSSVTIAPKAITCTAPTAKSLTYSASAQALVNAGSVAGGSMTYSTASTGTYSSSIPSGTSAGSYTVYWKGAPSSGNYSGSCSGSVSCSIAKADQAAPTATGATTTYPTGATATASGGGGQGTLTWTNGSSRSSCGSQTTKAYWAGNSNYNASPYSNEVTIKVNTGATPSYTAPTAKSGLVYNGSSQTLYNVGSSSNGTFSYSNGTRTSAGSQTVSWTFTPTDSCYYGTSGSFTASIAQKAVVCTAPTAKSLTWNGSAQTLANAGSCEGGTIQYCSTSGGTYSGTIPTGTNAGSYTVWYKCTASNNNYSGTCSGSTSCSIAKAAMSYTAPKAATRTYNGSAQQIVSGQSTNGGSIYYATSSAGASSSTTVPTQTNTGTSYSTYWKAVPDSNHSGGTSSWAQISNCTINPASCCSTAPTGKSVNYSGSGQALINAGSSSCGTMQYSGGTNSSYSTTIPSGTSAGSYTVNWKVTCSGNYSGTSSGSVTATINKVAMSYTAPSGATRNYTGSAQQVVSGGSATGGSIYYATSSAGASSSTTVPSQTNAASYDVYWRAVPDSNHSGGTSSWAKITGVINKVVMSYTAPSAATRTYNGSAQQIVSGQSANGGSIYYATSSAGASSSTTVPTQTNTGTSYSTYWKAVPDSNHSGGTSSWAQISNCKITQKALTITAKAQTVNYGTAITTGTGQVTTDGLVNGDSLTAITLTQSTTNVPGGTITPSNGATSKGIANYSVTYKTSTLTINKVAMSCCTPTAKSVTYNGSGQYVVNDCTPTGGDIYYATSSAGASSSTTVPSQTNVGTWTYYWKCVPDSNHSGGSSSWTAISNCKITQKALTITAKAQTINYGGSITTGTGQVTTSGLVNGDSLTSITLTPSTSNVPGGTITPSAGATSKGIGNYSVTYSNGTLTINKVAMTYTAPKAATRTYNGSAQQIVSGQSAGGGSIQFCSTSGGTYTTTVPTQTNTGTSYSTWWKAVPDSNHSGGTSAAQITNCTINKAALTITAKAQTVNYGTAITTGTSQVTTSGLVNGDSLTAITLTQSTTNVTTTGTITPSGGATSKGIGNYSVTYKTGTLTINKVAMSYTAPKAATRTYNGSAQQIVSGQSAGGGSIYYATSSAGASSSTTVPTATNTGTSYSTWWKAVPDSNHSGGTSSWAQITNCTINKAALTITAKAQTINYGGSITTGTGQVTTSGLVGGDSLTSITLTPSTSNVPGGTITPSAGATSKGIANYSVTYNTGTLTINKVAMSYTAPKAAVRTYNGSAQQIVSGGSATGGNIYYATSSAGASSSTTVPTQINAGSYTTYWKAVPDSNHSGGTSSWASISCSIAKAPGSVTINGVTTTYISSAQYLVTVSNNTGTMHYSRNGTSWSTTRPSSIAVGSYTIYWYMDASDNYEGIASASTRYVTSVINKASQTEPTATGATVTYHNTATATASGGNKQAGGLEWSNGNTRTAVGSQATKARWAGNDSFSASPWSNEVNLVVNKATDQSITVTLKNITYNGTSLCVASATKHGMKNFQLGFGSSSTSAPTSWTTDNYLYATNVGTYYIWYKGTVDENHSADISATYKGTATISCSGTTISTKPTAKTLTYNGSAQALVNAGTAPSNTTMYYNLNGGTWGTSIPSGTNAGTYTVGYQARGNNSNYCNSASGTVSVTIAKRAMTSCTPTAKSVVYNGSAQVIVNDCTPTGGDIQYSGGGNSSYSTTVPTRTDVGTYIINWKNVPDGNHSGGTTGQITTAKITCKACTAPTAKSLTYTGSAQALVNAGSTSYGTMVYSTSQNGTYSTSIPTGTNAGSYTVWWKVTGNTNVCCTSPASVAVTIAKANPVLSFSTSVTPSIIKQFYTHSAPVTVTSGDGTVSYSSSSTGYVTVNSSGTITGVKARFDSNEVKITATISEGTNFKSGSTSYWVEPVSCELALRPTSSTGTRFAFTRGNSIEYKIGTGGTWTTLASGSYTSTVSNGQRIFWRGSLSKVSGDGVGTFVASGGTYVAEGNAMSILFGGTSYYYQFSLAGKDNAAFDSLFGSENQLLTSAADLQLPATTLSKWCYYGMFLNCRKLTQGPCLPAPTLTEGCYYSMFQGCTELNRISCLATNISANACTYAWVNGVYSSGSGIFTKASSMSSWTTGDSGIPSGWSTANGTSCY